MSAKSQYPTYVHTWPAFVEQSPLPFSSHLSGNESCNYLPHQAWYRSQIFITVLHWPLNGITQHTPRSRLINLDVALWKRALILVILKGGLKDWDSQFAQAAIERCRIELDEIKPILSHVSAFTNRLSDLERIGTPPLTWLETRGSLKELLLTPFIDKDCSPRELPTCALRIMQNLDEEDLTKIPEWAEEAIAQCPEGNRLRERMSAPLKEPLRPWQEYTARHYIELHQHQQQQQQQHPYEQRQRGMARSIAGLLARFRRVEEDYYIASSQGDPETAPLLRPHPFHNVA